MQLTGKTSLLAGVAAAIGASACCVGPLVLLALGIGGSWISNLTAMEPYRPIFIGLTLLFLGLAFRQLYLVPQVCAPGTPCAYSGDEITTPSASLKASRKVVTLAGWFSSSISGLKCGRSPSPS